MIFLRAARRIAYACFSPVLRRWRVLTNMQSMGRDGLQSGETPLATQFEKGFESVQKHK